MKKLLFLLFFSLFFSRCFAESGEPVSFLTTGEIQDVDIEINKVGRGWLALHKTKDGWFLSNSKIKLKHRENMFIDIQSEYKNVEGLLKIKGLIAGKVLAKVGFFALLLKFSKFIIIGLIAAAGAAWKFLFKKKEPVEEIAETTNTPE